MRDVLMITPILTKGKAKPGGTKESKVAMRGKRINPNDKYANFLLITPVDCIALRRNPIPFKMITDKINTISNINVGEPYTLEVSIKSSPGVVGSV